jgi:hypothetical protein
MGVALEWTAPERQQHLEDFVRGVSEEFRGAGLEEKPAPPELHV